MRKLVFAEGEFYHIYNRGVDKRIIFTSPTEYERFLVYLYLLNTKDDVRPADLLELYSYRDLFHFERKAPLVALGAYCLMPNHIHLLMTPLVDGGISKYMQRVQTAYTMFFNTKHQRTGALFGGTFKAEHANRDTYLKYLFSYIHLNPAKLIDASWKEKGIKDFKKLNSYVKEYPYSSLSEYLTKKHIITNPSKFPEYFLEPRELSDHVDFWMESKKIREV